MQYLGGKARIAKPLSEYINSRLKDQQPYWEPFVGAGWVISKIDTNRKRYASDIHPELISMWKALLKKWIPPDIVSKEEYYKIKIYSKDMALRGFVGFGCSYSGKWWGGYANDNSGRNYATNAKNSLIKKIKYIQDVTFFCSHYVRPEPKEPMLIYCDIPYYGTTGYKNKFDHIGFWQWSREMTIKGHTVLISEYNAPPDFTCVWSHQTKTDMRVNNLKESRIEKLFEYIKG